MNKPISFCIMILSILLAMPLLAGCASRTDTSPISKTGIYFHTVITVTIYDSRKEDLLDECMTMADSYDKLLSPTIKGSDMWNINHSQGTPVTVSNDTIDLLNIALYYAKLSDGAVDPTIGSLSTLWNFGTENEGIIPNASEITDALSHVDYTMVQIDGNTVTLSDPDASLNLGFIAKGFIADQIKAFLVKNGVTSGIIDLGHNILTIGKKPHQTPYRIGIQKPFADTGVNAETVSVINQSVVSSGTYEQYFEKDGILYHHILSTVTGYPVENELDSVTILSDKSVDGDALSTLCFILGIEKGSALIERIPDTEAVFITKEGKLISTS